MNFPLGTRWRPRAWLCSLEVLGGASPVRVSGGDGSALCTGKAPAFTQVYCSGVSVHIHPGNKPLQVLEAVRNLTQGVGAGGTKGCVGLGTVGQLLSPLLGCLCHPGVEPSDRLRRFFFKTWPGDTTKASIVTRSLMEGRDSGHSPCFPVSPDCNRLCGPLGPPGSQPAMERGLRPRWGTRGLFGCQGL